MMSGLKQTFKGSSKTGNATKDKDGNDLGNVVSSELGEKMLRTIRTTFMVQNK
jgi:hypothetical protein